MDAGWVAIKWHTGGIILTLCRAMMFASAASFLPDEESS